MIPPIFRKETLGLELESWLRPQINLAIEQTDWLEGGDSADVVLSEDLPIPEAPPPKLSFEDWKKSVQGLPEYCRMSSGEEFYQGFNYGVIVRPKTKTFTFFHATQQMFLYIFDEAFSGTYTTLVLPAQWETAHTSFFSPSAAVVSFEGIKEEWTEEEIEKLIAQGDARTLNAIIRYSVDGRNRFKLQNVLANSYSEDLLVLYSSCHSSPELDQMILMTGLPLLPEESIKKLIDVAIGKGDHALVRSILGNLSQAPFFNSLVAFVYDAATLWGSFDFALSLATHSLTREGLPIPEFCFINGEKDNLQIPFIQALLQRALFTASHKSLRKKTIDQAAIGLLKLALAQEAPKLSTRVSCLNERISLSGIDFCFLRFLQGNETGLHLGLTLFKQGEKPSEAVSHLLLSTFLSDPHKYQELQPVTGLEPPQIERLLKEASGLDSEEHFLQELLSGELLLKKWIRQVKQNSEWIDMTRFEALRALKKRAKKKGLQGSIEYTSFVTAYDQLTSLCPLLNFLQKVSAFLRGKALLLLEPLKRKEALHRLLYDPFFDPINVERATLIYLSLFAFPYARTTNEIQAILRGASPLEKRRLCQSARQQVIKGCSTPIGPLCPSRLHGTKLVPSMVEMGQLVDPKTLRGRAVLLSGEHSGSDIPGNANDGLVSTADLSSSFRPRARYSRASSGVALAQRYAYMGLGGSEAHSHLNLRVEVAIIKTALNKISFSEFELSRITKAIERLRSFQAGQAELLALQAHLSKLHPNAREILQKSFEHPVVLASPDLLKEIPLPIIFGSSSQSGNWWLHPDYFPPLSEFSFKSPVSFGTDLQYAFAPGERLSEARKKLSPFLQMELFPFESLYVGELQRMISGESLELFLDNYPSAQQWISFLLKRRVLPLYATPFPKHPFYRRQNGQKLFLEGINYEEFSTHEAYLSAVEAETISPRGYHGKTHACCAAILAQLFYAIYQREKCPPYRVTLEGIEVATEDDTPQDEGALLSAYVINIWGEKAHVSRFPQKKSSLPDAMDEEDEKEFTGNRPSRELLPSKPSPVTQSPKPKKIPLDPALVALSAAYHDCGRQHGGKDYWDQVSGAQLRADLIAFGYPDIMIAPCYHALAEKDPANGVFTSLIQEIVNSADTLEILRIIRLDQFKLDLLPAARLFIGREEEIQSLVREWKEFRDWLKPLLLYLDLQSPNPYEDLMILLSRKGGKMVRKYLDFSEWSGKPLSETLEKFLDE